MAYRTPDVYVKEISIFPPSVAEVQTAVPAFVGYTEKATRSKDGDLSGRPTKVRSMQDFETLFGGPQNDYGSTQPNQFLASVDVTKDAAGLVTSVDAVDIQEPKLTYLLHYAMNMFFANGGGQCYIVSVGGYKKTSPSIDVDEIMLGLNKLKDEDEPTLLVIPEAASLSDSDYKTVTEGMLAQCASLQDRFSVLDLLGGGDAAGFVDHDDSASSVKDNNSQQRNREQLGSKNLSYGSVYYPFIKTTQNYFVDEAEDLVQVKLDDGSGAPDAAVGLGTMAASNTQVYNAVKAEIKNHYVVLPPSSAVVGVYAATDENRGVWKAPANVGLSRVVEPLVKVDNAIQDELNVDSTSGKSINAIRAFAGKGTLIWGARTLAGNDNEWRYNSVRRLFITLEESIKKSTYWAVFEPNDANTWVKVRGMIENYLTQKWREGALAGAAPSDAFYVRCGLGETMSAQDILEGRMNVEIGIAAVRPAEFIILKFSHLLQTS